MKISVNSVLAFNANESAAGDIASIGVERLAERIGAQLGAIEEISYIGEAYAGIVIAKVKSCVKHPDADRLKVCLLDDNGVVKGVERDSNGLVQVVCGAQNVREGILVAWLPPGTTVPKTFADDPFILSVQEIRGKMSNGMLASSRELAINDNHDGILEIDGNYNPGSDFAEVFNLAHDVVFDIENKMFTHRPDCFGLIGIARELAGIQAMTYKSPAWYQPDATIPDIRGAQLPLTFNNELPELVPRFTAVVLRDVTIQPSPVWLQIELSKIGIRSINNIVDYSNYFMALTAQPIHIYDYDKVRAIDGENSANLVVRNPKPGEKLRLLNGKDIEPRAQAMMVATKTKLICVGGAMGGSDTEVDHTTTNIIIEAATWDMYEIRRTSMANGIFTDAVTRFNKGQSPLQNKAVLAKIVGQILKDTDAKVASKVIDNNNLDSLINERHSLHPDILVSARFINDRLGSTLSPVEMAKILINTEFTVSTRNNMLTVRPPFWRTDIELREDIVEEVGRLYGYGKLPQLLPKRDIGPAHVNSLLSLKNEVRLYLVRAGAHELLTYSFVHGDLLEKTGQDKSLAFKLSNALSPELQYYRLSLIPSLIDKIHFNIKAGYHEFALFELGKVYQTNAIDDEGLPVEFDKLALVYASKSSKAGAAYYHAQYLMRYVLKSLHVGYDLRPLLGNSEQCFMPFEPKRSALVIDHDSKKIIGIVGEFRNSVRKKLKLPDYSAGFELATDMLLELKSIKSLYNPLSKYPKVEQDICLKVNSELSYADLYSFMISKINESKPLNCYTWLSPLDIYKRNDDIVHRQITFRLGIASYERTMTDQEVNQLLETISAAAAKQYGAERI
jgi:phenylalanyl-tRNA synthetase beta chain